MRQARPRDQGRSTSVHPYASGRPTSTSAAGQESRTRVLETRKLRDQEAGSQASATPRAVPDDTGEVVAARSLRVSARLWQAGLGGRCLDCGSGLGLMGVTEVANRRQRSPAIPGRGLPRAGRAPARTYTRTVTAPGRHPARFVDAVKDHHRKAAEFVEPPFASADRRAAIAWSISGRPTRAGDPRHERS